MLKSAIFTLTFVFLIGFFANAQNMIPNHPDIILRAGHPVPKVLLVGTFHFGYPGLDAHQTDDKYKIDIKSPEKQKEVEALVNYMASFNPTKIMVEAGRNTGFLINEFRRWQKGEEELDREEIDQICYRLMDRFNLDTIYGVDAMSLVREIVRSDDSTTFKSFLDSIYAEQNETTNPFDERYWEWYDEDDVLTYEMNLLDYFKYLNSDIVIKRMHGHYILSDQTNDYNAMDGLLLNWYSRNLRIFKNIQMVETKPEDRIMILFGAGHIGILKQQFEASPEYELIEFNELGD